MLKENLLYSVEEWDKDIRYSLQIEGEWDELFGEAIVANIAKDAHSNHGGWESSWPLTFAIYGQDSQLLGRYSVDRESIPHFVPYELDR